MKQYNTISEKEQITLNKLIKQANYVYVMNMTFYFILFVAGSIDAEGTGKGNKFFLCGIIEGPLTDLLRDILTKEVPPQILLQRAKDLAEPQKNKKPLIMKEQEKLINEGQYTKFDISLLYVLIRNCTNIPQHANRWGNTPSAGDKSVSANIERIRLIRNKYAHVDTIHVSDTEYDHRWKEIFDIVQGLENYLDTPFSYQDILKAFKIKSMDQNQSERFIELFLVFYKTQKELFGNFFSNIVIRKRLNY